MFFTMIGEQEASDKYHKPGEKLRQPDQPLTPAPKKSIKKPASRGVGLGEPVG
jgi:hypothetical protein